MLALVLNWGEYTAFAGAGAGTYGQYKENRWLRQALFLTNSIPNWCLTNAGVRDTLKRKRRV